jgi:acetyl esterase/lipase
MRSVSAAALIILFASLSAAAQTSVQTSVRTSPAPSLDDSWTDPATWRDVHPTETDNIVYRNVPRIPNAAAAASPDPGTPNGIRQPIPNTGAPGTMDLHLDVYHIPSAKPTPVVIQLHGGGWIRGDRPSSYRGFAALLAAGMSVVAVEYRNAKDAPAPAAIQDTRCAMAWVKAHAAQYNFDPNRVILYGGSAGGHLALMGAYAPASFNPPGCTDQPRVAAVLDFYGPTNLAEGLTQNGSSSFTHQWLNMDLPLNPVSPASSASSSAPSSLDAAPGTTSTSAPAPQSAQAAATPARREPQRWPEPTPSLLARAREMSPLTYIHPGLPPTFIVNGDADHTVDPTQSAELKSALDAAHVPNGQDIVHGGGHGNFGAAEDTKAMLLSLEFLKANGVIQ